MKSVFVSVIGQEDNVGDSLLRRGLMNALRHSDIQLHVLIGSNSESYCSALGLRPDDVLYRSRGDWIRSLKVNRGRGATTYVSNAGEVQLTNGLKYLGRAQIVALARVRANRGHLVHAGVGVRSPEQPSVLARWNVLRFFDLVSWRDQESRDYAGIGEVLPDWAFALGSSVDEWINERRHVAISLRGDRPAPGPGWIEAVRSLSQTWNLSPIVLSQVQRDNSRASELAAELACSSILWGGESHTDWESRVRRVYGASDVVISDRLHSLIIGATEGAVPVGLVPGSPSKVSRTMSVVGLGDLCGTIESLPLGAIANLDELRGATRDAVSSARQSLETLAQRIQNIVLG